MATATMTVTDVSTASAAALAAASATSRPQKQRPSPLPTPQSATFPSALQSPLPSAGRLGSALLRPEKSLKTPLTPPAAYLDFLRNIDKAKSPLNSSASASFNFSQELRSPYPWPKQPASARPILVSQESTESNQSVTSNISQVSNDTTTTIRSAASDPPKPLARRSSDAAELTLRAASTSDLPARPRQSTAIRRPSLLIPESPSFRSPSLLTPATSARMQSPSSSTASALAAKKHYLSMSPLSATPSGETAPVSAGGSTLRPLRITHQITRTVTYTRPAGTTAQIGTHSTSSSPRGLPNQYSRPSSTTSDEDSRGKMRLDFVLDPEGGERRRGMSASTEQSNDAPIAQVIVSPPVDELPRPTIGEAPKGKRRKME